MPVVVTRAERGAARLVIELARSDGSTLSPGFNLPGSSCLLSVFPSLLLAASVGARLQLARGAQEAYAERLHALSPLAVLGRGYAICRTVDGGMILKDSAAVRTGDAVHVTLHRGSLGCAVTEVRTDGKPEEGV